MKLDLPSSNYNASENVSKIKHKGPNDISNQLLGMQWIENKEYKKNKDCSKDDKKN